MGSSKMLQKTGDGSAKNALFFEKFIIIIKGFRDASKPRVRQCVPVKGRYLVDWISKKEAKIFCFNWTFRFWIFYLIFRSLRMISFLFFEPNIASPMYIRKDPINFSHYFPSLWIASQGFARLRSDQGWEVQFFGRCVFENLSRFTKEFKFTCFGIYVLFYLSL